MSTAKIVLIFIGLIFLPYNSFGQDTIRLAKKPNVIIKSWYPEFKEFPRLKIGESKILFTIIPDFENTSIHDNDIDLIPSINDVLIEETEKTNQYLITVNSMNYKTIELELWFALENKTVLLKKGSEWKNIKLLYPVKGNRILIDKIKLGLVE